MQFFLKVLLMVLAVSLMAQVSFDLGPIPITGQTLAILVVAALIGPVESLIGIVLYIALGALGAPIFAGGSSGVQAVTGNTAGYFLGFFVASGAVGSLSAKAGQKATFNSHLTNQVIGTAIIMIAGMVWLAMQNNVSSAIQYGFAPLWPGAVFKILLGSVLVWLIKTKLLQ